MGSKTIIKMLPQETSSILAVACSVCAGGMHMVRDLSMEAYSGGNPLPLARGSGLVPVDGTWFD